jgi:DNA-binding CsgD family transcriptional regulator
MGSAAIDYGKHLYSTDLDGYLQLAHIPNSGPQTFKGAYVVGQTIPRSLQEVEGQADYFITPNSYYIPERSSRNIRHFRALYIDLDLTDYGKAEAVYEVALLAGAGKIPEPTMIIDSGRGLHLYWRINHAPVGAAWTWQELQDYLYRQLRHLGADPAATDSARLLRIPGTINSRNGALCRPVVITDKQYSMYDLRDQYLAEKPKTKQKQKRTSGGTVSPLYNPYTLHKARLSDLLTLCRLRNFNVEGHRNNILHLYAYWQGITVRNSQELERAVIALNESFKEPLRATEVNAVIRCIPKAIKAFLDPAAGPAAGYNYKNETLIDMLAITEKEQQHLKTIIGTKEKYKRKNERRKEARRNEAGLTPRQQQAEDTATSITELRAQGLTLKEIAKEVGLTVKGVEYHLYSK